MRHLIRLLCLALVPVLVVSMPRAAEAAFNTSEAGFAIHLDLPAYGYGDVDCNGTVQLDSNGIVWLKSGFCEGGPDVSPGWAQPGEANSSYQYWVTGTNCTGSSEVGTLGDYEYNGTTQVSGALNGVGGYYAKASATVGTNCDPAQFCLRLTATGYGGGSTYYDCVPINLDPPDDTETTDCSTGTVDRPRLGPESYWSNSTYNGWNQTYRFGVMPTATANWRWYIIEKNADGSSWTGTNYFQRESGLFRYRYDGPAAQAYSTWPSLPASTKWTQAGTIKLGTDRSMPTVATIGWHVVGMGIYRAQGTDYIRGAYNANGPRVDGMIGVSDPANCAFYWGEKIASTTSDTKDEPLGPLLVDGGSDGGTVGSPPDTTQSADPGCADFSWTDPTTYASGGICVMAKLLQALLGLMGDILGVLKGLTAAIVDGIGTLLQSLFIPSSGFMQSKADQIKTAWDDTPPGVFVGSVSDVGDALSVASPASSCDGPALTFTDPVSKGTDTLHPMSTCSGPVATIASLVKLALTIGVYLGAFLVALRLLAGALGLDLRIGGGGDPA